MAVQGTAFPNKVERMEDARIARETRRERSRPKVYYQERGEMVWRPGSVYVHDDQALIDEAFPRPEVG